MQRQTLRVPREDGALLGMPDLKVWPELARKNALALANSSVLIGGLPLPELRERARFELLGTGANGGPDGLLIATGHQPELYHPGVWIKNFATAKLAQTVGGTGLHVIIDNDTLKSSSIQVPAGEPEAPYVATVPFDRWDGEAPFEERSIVDREVFVHFGKRVCQEMGLFPYQPLVSDFWLAAVEMSKQTDNVGAIFSHARRVIEQSWGVENHETALSELCVSTGFCRLAAELLIHSERFASIHNSALMEYRKLNGIRSRNHPVADLAADSQSVEVPFWAWTGRFPEREHVFAQHHGSKIRLHTAKETIGELPTNVDALTLALQSGLGEWKFRPRALITTLFLRLVVADFFLHGVGGGKYDELTDEIIRRFFHIQPPAFAILSATVLLGTGTSVADQQTLNRLAELKHQRRDMAWNPDRYLDERIREMEPAAEWIEKKHELMQQEGDSRADRIRRYREFRSINEKLFHLLGQLPDGVNRELGELQQESVAIGQLNSREFSMLVHDPAKLREFFDSSILFDSRAPASAGLSRTLA